MPNPEKQEPSGLDLAREALAEYKKRTWAVPSKTPGQPKPKPRRFVRTGDRRDPARIGGAFADLSTDPRWEAGLAGGSIIDQWPTLCPQYAGLVQPVHYEEQTGRLDLRPGSHSYAAQLRLLGGQLAKQINDKLGKPVVRTIRVLPVGAVDTTPAADTDPQRTESQGPVKTRETASTGYRDTLALALEHKPEKQPTNPYVIDAIARQEAALRAGRPPEPERQDDAETAGPKPGSIEASLAAARAYARQQRAGHTPRRAFDVA